MSMIPWYQHDPRFLPGTVADVGEAFRLELKKTKRKYGSNKWRLYMGVRTHEKHGVDDDLKRDVCVAEFSGKLSLEEVQLKADEYLKDFMQAIIDGLS